MKSLLLNITIAGFLLLFYTPLLAQETVQKQIWPEIEAYYRFNERFRLYSDISTTRSNSEYTDGTAGIYLDFFAKPWLNARRNDTEMTDSSAGYYWWFRAGYSYSDAPPYEKQKVINIFETESNNAFFLPADIVLQTRNRFDWRWVNGDFQPVYRPRAKFIRNLKTDYLIFNLYLQSEYFFYLNDNTENRFRLTFGTVIKVVKWMDFETYYTYQFQNKQYVAPLNALGIQLDLYFRSKSYQPNKKAP